MKTIEPSVELIEVRGLYERIEIAARTCWKSEDKITPGSAEKLVAFLMKKGHESPLEHSRLIIEVNPPAEMELIALAHEYEAITGIPSFLAFDHYADGGNFTMVSANLRAWRHLCQTFPSSVVLCDAFCGAKGFGDIAFEPDAQVRGGKETIYFGVNYTDLEVPDRHAIITARFICDRGVTHELVRHRTMSFSQESTRYVNYKDGITCIQPGWWNDFSTKRELSCAAFEQAESAYASLSFCGSNPGEARLVLPNALKTEIVVSGTVEQWKKCVLPLRLSKAAHPDIRRVMEMFCEKLDWNPDEFRK